MQHLFGVSSHLVGTGLRSVALDGRSVWPHQELGEVPLDGRSKKAVGPVFQEREHWVGLRAVDVDLRRERERHPVLDLAKFLDLIVIARLLVGELVAGEADDDEAFGSELGVDLLQTPILRGEAALARSVHDQHRLASELLQGHLLTGIRGETEVVDRIPHTPIVLYR